MGFAKFLPSLAFAINKLIIRDLARFAKAVKAKIKHKETRVRARADDFSLRKEIDFLTFEIENSTFGVEFSNTEVVVLFLLIIRRSTAYDKIRKFLYTNSHYPQILLTHRIVAVWENGVLSERWLLADNRIKSVSVLKMQDFYHKIYANCRKK